MKTVAFYLPQFHAIPENDEWWGEGFTEWTNVKAAKPQYKGHVQPEIPLNKNYYNLLDAETQVWQARLASNYGIDAFCYYHYWFEGKLLLEKPMENMLANPEVDIPFCVCWANETWARTWDGQETSVLIKQNYNESKDAWKRHFEYLLPFFKDKRYLKDQGRPILLIYKPYLITNCKEILAYWRELARENGFTDLYLGYQYPESFNYDMDDVGFDFGVEFEPLFTVHEMNKKSRSITGKLIRALKNPGWAMGRIRNKLFREPNLVDYDKVWNTILNRVPKKANVMPGAFPAWDNSPRKGNRSTAYVGATPAKFEKYFSEQVRRAEEIYHSNYIFINAWNEWGEGAHLEPDEKNGYGYLEAVKNVSSK